MVAEFVPDKHKRLLAHIRKMAERKKRQQKAKSEYAPKVGSNWALVPIN